MAGHVGVGGAGTYPAIAVQFAPDVAASAVPAGGDWVDVTGRVADDWSIKWGRWGEFTESGAGTADLRLSNSDGLFDPDNTAGTYYTKLVAGTWFRILLGTTSADTDAFYGHVSDAGFRVDASQFPDSWVNVSLVDDMEQLANTDLPESVYAIEVEADSPAAWYRLGESSGTVASDSSGNARHGTYEGGATFNSRAGLIAGSADNAIGFDGVDDSVAAPALISGVAFTIEAWVRMPTVPSSSTKNGTIYAQGERGSGSGGFPAVTMWVWRYGSGADGKIAVRYGVASDTTTTEESTVRVDDDLPHHVVVTRTAGGVVTIYVDGVNRTAGSGSVGTIVPPTGSGAVIGSDRAANAYEFAGTLDEVAVYGSALSAARIAAHYAAGTAPWANELSSARVTHLLDSVDFPAPLRNVDAGQTLMPMASLAGGDAASAVRAAAKAEAGYVYVGHQDGGKLRFVDRHERWTAAASVTSQATCGDQGSEITYDAVALADDRILNRVTMQRFGGSGVTVSDPTSEGARRRTYSETGLLITTAREAASRAARIVAEKKDRHRVPTTITLRPRKSTHSAWPHVFARRIDDRITVKWRPPWGGTQTYDAYIDGIAHRRTTAGLDTTFSLSPVPYDNTTTAPYFIVGTSTVGGPARIGF